MMKRHSWIWGIIITTALGGFGVWVGKVDAYGTKVVQMETIVPRVESQLTKISEKQDQMQHSMSENFTDVKQRISRLEGRNGR
jgi:hypothetical protein